MHTPSYQLLDADTLRSAAAQDASASAQSDKRTAGAILCATCGAHLSDASQRIDVAGRHQHTFFNPEGIVYQVVCFATAPGCLGIGSFAPPRWLDGNTHSAYATMYKSVPVAAVKT